MERVVSLMLDSGAYSAFTLGKVIDIEDYIAFIKKNEQYLDTYINLDVIPGAPGRIATVEETHAAAKASYANQQYMKKQGLAPIPVFHSGEEWKWLRRYIADGEPYIALSLSVADRSFAKGHNWLDQAFTLLTDREGRAIRKVHGLGLSTVRVMRRYPWASVDAATWGIAAGMGQIYVPPYTNGNPDYHKPPLQVIVTDLERKYDRKAFANLPPSAKAQIVDYLEKHVKTTLLDVVNDDMARARVILTYLLGVAKACDGVRFQHRVALHG